MTITRREAIRTAVATGAIATMGSAGRTMSISAEAPFRVLSILVRKNGMSAEEFRLQWLGVHGQIARNLPGIRGLIFSEAFGGGAGGAPASSFPMAIDGFAQMWFANREAFVAATASDQGKKWIADGDRLIDRQASRSFALGMRVVIEPPRLEGLIKRTILIVRKQGMTKPQFLKYWLSRHAELASGVPGLIGAVFNPVQAMPGSPANEPEFDGITETWWETSPDDLGGKPRSAAADAWMADADNCIDLERSRTVPSLEHVLIAPE